MYIMQLMHMTCIMQLMHMLYIMCLLHNMYIMISCTCTSCCIMYTMYNMAIL